MRARRFVQALVVAATLLVGVVVIGIASTQTTWFRNWLRGYITREAHQYLNGELSIGRLGGNLFFGVELEDVAITLNGQPVMAVKDISLRYNSLEFIRKGISIESIRIDHPLVYLQRDAQGWAIAHLVRKNETEADRSGPGRPLTITSIDMSAGSVVFAQPLAVPGVVVPNRIDDIDAQLAFRYEPVHYSVDIAHIAFRGTNPDIVISDISGGVSVHDDEIDVRKLVLRTGEFSISADGGVRDYLTTPSFKMQASADRVSLPELARIIPSLAGIELRPSVTISADGRLDQLNAALDVRSTAGTVSGQVIVGVSGPEQSIRGTLTVGHLDLAPLTGRATDKSDVSAVVTPDLRAASLSNLDSLRGTVAIDAPASTASGYVIERVKGRATITGRDLDIEGAVHAYGAASTVNGRVTLPLDRQPVVFDVNGNFQGINLAHLPKQWTLPAAETAVNGQYRASGVGTEVLHADVRLADSDLPGAHLASGTVLTASMKSGGGSTPQVDYTAAVTASRVDLQAIGNAFGVTALCDDRYQTLLNVDARASGHGTSPATMDAAIRGELAGSTLFVGRVPQLTFDATLDRDVAHIKATGTLADLDPAVVSGRPQIAGTVAGSVDVDATIAHLSAGIAIDGVDGDATVSLEPSQVGGLRIDRGRLEASYRDEVLDVRSLDVTGRDMSVRASGAIALSPTGASDLKAHADLFDLTALGKLADQELTGLGTVDAAITGNRTALTIKGHLKGAGLSAGNNGALALSTDYTVDAPNLSVDDATVAATTTAMFVTVAGQHVDELTATTRYRQSELDIDVNARQARRSMSAAGTVRFQPDQREVVLTRLDLAEQSLQWHLAPDSKPTVRYGDSVTTVNDMRLVSGDQEIDAAGAFGKGSDAASPLSITVKNIDLANVDALLLRPPQFSGRLNGSATVSGSVDDPHVQGDFAVNQGGFREFRYESLQGKAEYDGRGVRIDSQLQQNPTAWLRATGYVPSTAFTSTTAAKTVPAAAATADAFDLHIETTPIDLGLVQGLTTALTGVTGTAQANIQVTGPGTDPRPTGDIRVANGAFKVDATGVSYTGLNGHIELQGDRVHIETLGVSDNARSRLTVTGDVPIRQALTGDVQLQITARDFKVLDNNMGNVRINSDLRVTGELRAPRVEGDLALSTGTVNLDPLLATASDGAYATKPTEYLTAPQQASNPQQTSNQKPASDAQTPGLSGVAMNVHVTVPDDLVVKSNDLRTSSAPIGLGALNITLGGDVRAIKAPNQTVRLTGTVTTVRGTYQFQGRQFTILRDGNVRFDDEAIDQLNPTLNIRTQRIIQGVQTNANILGTLQNPRIDLSSVPALERADILSLIVFNQPVNQLGEGQQISLNQRAEQLALGSVAGQLSKSLGSLLNVSEFQIQAAPDTGAAAQLTVGQQVSQNLFVRVEQGIGDVSTTNAVLEYELKNWLRLRTNLVQASTAQQALFQAVLDSGFDLIFTFTR
jgi:autotransporter translocation and assembly factor TamB